jgi:hypothetical protein
MNRLLGVGIAAVVLIFATDNAAAQELLEGTEIAAPQQTVQQPQEMRAQPNDDSSYGGVASSKGMSSMGTRPASCNTAPQCDIFFGH